jgi:hypothetical protein
VVCITFILYVIGSASCAYWYSDGLWNRTVYISSQILGTAIKTVMIFVYVNIVLVVKQRYHHMKHLLSEADSTTEFDTSKCVYLEDVTRNSSNTMFSSAKIIKE